MTAATLSLSIKMAFIFLVIAILAVTRFEYPIHFENGFCLTKSFKSFNFIRSLPGKREIPLYCSLKNASDYEAGCAIEAIKRARKFFRQNGYEMITPISIEFVNKVEGGVVKAGKGCSKKEEISALYNAGTKCIRIVGFDTDYFKRRAMLGAFRIDKEFYISLITHEVAHRLYDSLIGYQVETIYHPYSEFIAYVTQIGTLKKNYRNKVLSLFSGEQFPSIYAINSFVWAADPNKFGLMSYRFYESQPVIFQDILENKVKPMELGFILEY